MYQVFIPKVTGAKLENLTAVGLGDLLAPGDRNPDSCEILRGPDGNHGQLWGWTTDATVLSFDPKRHTAWPCVADPVRGLAAGRFWWIFETGKPPTEAELRRTEQFNGFPYALNDGREWRVPNVLELPEAFGYDDHGHLVKVAKQAWRPFVEDCEWALHQCLVAVGEEGDRDWRRELDVAVRVLNANYRMNRELILKLELIDPQNVLGILMRAVDRSRLIGLVDELKNSTAGPATLVGSGA